MNKQDTCKKCKKKFDKESVKRWLSDKSPAYLGGFCSAKCYAESNVLFNVEAEPREVVFTIKSYKQNRILNKLLKLLKRDQVFKISENRSKDPEDCRIFTVSILSKDTIQETANTFKNELISYIPDAFPPRYLFDFSGDPLGFVRSFEVFDNKEDLLFVCYHKIKEIRTNGESIKPDPKDQVKV